MFIIFDEFLKKYGFDEEEEWDYSLCYNVMEYVKYLCWFYVGILYDWEEWECYKCEYLDEVEDDDEKSWSIYLSWWFFE